MTNATPVDTTSPETTPYWRLEGARPGPVLRVTGAEEVVGPVSARLSALPSLVYLRGTLEVAATPAPGDGALDVTGVSPEEAYWWVLARAAALGMISGRGIPQSWLAAA